jgi:hypothetical protein
MIEIDERENDQCCGQCQKDRPFDAESEFPIQQNTDNPCKRFDEWITRRDSFLAMTTAPAEYQVTSNRNIVVPGDQFLAVSAAGSRYRDRNAFRQTKNNDIQETTDRQSK